MSQDIFSKNYLSSTLSKNELLKRLKRLSGTLSKLKEEQQTTITPTFLSSITNSFLLSYSSQDVQLLVANCIADILRIFAPQPPFQSDSLRDIFSLFIKLLPLLDQVAAHYYSSVFHLLENLSLVRSCIILVEAKKFDLICQLFEDITGRVEFLIVDLLSSVLEEMDSIPSSLLNIILKQTLDQHKNRIALKLLERNIQHLENAVSSHLQQKILHSSNKATKKTALNIVVVLCNHLPDILLSFLPTLQNLLEDEDKDNRCQYTILFGEVFTTEGSLLAKNYPNLFHSFLRRFNDVDNDIRLALSEFSSSLLLNYYPEYTEEICQYLTARIQDPDDRVRKAVIISLTEAALHEPDCVTLSLLSHLGRRTLDRKGLVSREAILRLSLLFRQHVVQYWANGHSLPEYSKKYSWIARKLIYASIHHNSPLANYVETVFKEKIFNINLDSMQISKVLVAIFLSLDNNAVECLKKRFFYMKSTLQENVLRLIQTYHDLKAEPQSKTILKQQHLYAQRITSHLGSDVKVEQIINIINYRDHKSLKYLSSLASPSTSRQKIFEDTKEFVSLFSSDKVLKDVASRLALNSSLTFVTTDNILFLFQQAIDELVIRPHITLNCLSLLNISLHSLPSLSPNNFLSIILDYITTLSKQNLQNWSLLSPLFTVLYRVAISSPNIKFKKISQIYKILMKCCKESIPMVAKYSLKSLLSLHPPIDSIQDFLSDLVETIPSSTNKNCLFSTFRSVISFDSKLFEPHQHYVLNYITKELWKEMNPLPENPVINTPSIIFESNLDTSIQLVGQYLNSFDDAEKIYNNVYLIPWIQLLEYQANSIHGLCLACSLTKCCCNPYFERIITPQQWILLMTMAQNSNPYFQQHFIDYIFNRLKTNKLSYRWSLLFILAVDHHNTEWKTTLLHYYTAIVQRQRIRNIQRLNYLQDHENMSDHYYTEWYISDLIWFISHNTHLENLNENIHAIIEYFSLFYDAILTSKEVDANYLYAVLQTIRLHIDIHDPDSIRIYQLQEIAIYLLNHRLTGLAAHSTPFHPISLRTDFYRKIDNKKSSPPHEYLHSSIISEISKYIKGKKSSQGSFISFAHSEQKEEKVEKKKKPSISLSPQHEVKLVTTFPKTKKLKIESKPLLPSKKTINKKRKKVTRSSPLKKKKVPPTPSRQMPPRKARPQHPLTETTDDFIEEDFNLEIQHNHSSKIDLLLKNNIKTPDTINIDNDEKYIDSNENIQDESNTISHPLQKSFKIGRRRR